MEPRDAVFLMNLQIFEASLVAEHPPQGLSPALQALWYDGHGDWLRAHELAQQAENAGGERVHAYLHRKEGDEANAAYWYQRCGCERFEGSLEAEWRAIAASLLAAAQANDK